MLLVDKPVGLTSHDVVARVRRTSGERRIGHAGTLDPFATGLLVLLLGRGTRLLPYVEGEPKVYEAVIVFGTESATDDCTGVPVRSAPVPSAAAVAGAVASLTGTIEQLPPAFSAKKVGGRRSYAAARRGESLELRPVTVTVHGWELLGWEGEQLHARITCGGGTYIRALARDLGRLTDSAAHLGALRRSRSGPFDVNDAAHLDDPQLAQRRLPLRAAIPSMPAVRLDPQDQQRVASGMRVDAAGSDARRAALLSASGDLLAVAERQGGEWQPRLVLT